MLAGAIAVAILLLPSALNLPQSNPTTVLEYAPVPPEEDNPPPPASGNLSSLGLGTSSALQKKAPPLPPPIDEGIGGRPQQKRCIGNPPRQTEDPASPPCVPFFEGDNFGATYQGVDKNEIRVLVYYDAGGYGFLGRTEDSPANGTYVDIDRPRLPNCPPGSPATSNPTDPNECDHVIVRVLKAFSKYFNSRFQTYNRHVHFIAYFTAADTAAERRSDAVANWEKVKPFAVIDGATFNGFNQEYQTSMTQLGAVTFSSTEAGLPNRFFLENAPLAWGFWPDIEHWEALFSSYLCTKVVPHKVKRFNGGVGGANGQPRKFGIFYPVDPAEPDLQTFADLLLADLRRCGVEPVEATYSVTGFAVDSADTGTEAAEAVARFQSEDVTTVIYVGTEGRFTNALDAVRYYPEIVVAGQLDNDNNFFGQVQNQNAWQNAWAMTYHIRINRLEDAPGYRAYKEGDPAGASNPNDSAGVFARDSYRDVFMLFQGIQVAGPRLTPESVDKGFHAIPEKESDSPYTAAFFFDEGDYSSVKDGMEEWWDPSGRSRGGGTPSNRPGCWRVVREGKRFLAGQWEGGDDVFENGNNDSCTGYDGSIRTRTPGA